MVEQVSQQPKTREVLTTGFHERKREERDNHYNNWKRLVGYNLIPDTYTRIHSYVHTDTRTRMHTYSYTYTSHTQTHTHRVRPISVCPSLTSRNLRGSDYWTSRKLYTRGLVAVDTVPGLLCVVLLDSLYLHDRWVWVQEESLSSYVDPVRG